jgi:hypothetical protein
MSRKRGQSWITRVSAVGFLTGLLVLASGCGGGVGDVSGKITYKGKEVVYGTVSFVGADGIPRTAKINPDGTYTVKDVAVGEAKITVVSELPPQGGNANQGKGGRGGRAVELPPDAPKDLPRRDEPDRGETPEVVDPEIVKKWFPIPADLGDVTKTKLRFQVRKGPNTHDIQLD